MRLKSILFFSAHALFLTMLFTPQALLAANVTLNVPQNYPTIQAAIDHAASVLTQNTGTTTTYSVFVEPGTYSERIVLQNNINVTGSETARTIINGGGTGVAVTANNVTNITFSRFTIINTAIGMQVTNNANVGITNNVFSVGAGNTGIQAQGAANTSIINNAFYQNGIAITRDADIKINNNIFSENATNISQGGLIPIASIDYNLFNPEQTATSTEPIGTYSIPNINFPAPDPLFVDPLKRDFHVQEGSPCINAGKVVGTLTPDMGPYGGQGADTIPMIVSGVSATASAADSISISWSPNNAYNVTNTDPALQGGYNVYYRLSTGTTATAVSVPGGTTSTVISGLTVSSSAPAAPVLNEPGYANETLLLSWSSVPGATKYIVHVLDQTTLLPEDIEVVGATSKELTGLVNNRHYTITVSAVSQPVYYLKVTAFDNQGPNGPGIDHESDYSSEVPVPFGTPAESPLSTAWDAYPEALMSYPNLENKGWCFIATAAYGHYDAPQVQALRDFRDRFLLTNAAGRTFVQWYYTYGPLGAAYMNEHPWLKPIIRTALMPAVGGSLLLTRAPAAALAAILMVSFTLLALLIRRKKPSPRGGSR